MFRRLAGYGIRCPGFASIPRPATAKKRRHRIGGVDVVWLEEQIRLDPAVLM
jgi:hypothetical protein